MVHRFLYRTRRDGNAVKIVAKADNLFTQDYPFTNDCLIGKVIGLKTKGKEIDFERKSRYIAKFLVAAASLIEALIFETVKRIKNGLY